MAKMRTKDISPELTASLDRLVNGVNAAGAKIQALKDAVKTGMSSAEVAQVHGAIDTIATNLEAVSADV